ncbi:unnamed protein product [Schistosoma spindalis]|nr:unnamed protein product [Schistosoma spindale]
MRTGVIQGCSLSLFLCSSGCLNYGIQWTDWMQLDNLDSADDIALLFYTPANEGQNNQCSRRRCNSRPQHTQVKKQDHDVQYSQNQPDHTLWTRFGKKWKV